MDDSKNNHFRACCSHIVLSAVDLPFAYLVTASCKLTPEWVGTKKVSMGFT